MDPGMLVRRDAIIDVLWGEEPPRTAVNLVQAHVSRLRRVLRSRECSVGGDGVIDSVRGAYRVRLPVEELDLLLFKDLAARAAAARANGDDAIACELYENAVRLWRGDPLADVDMLSGHPGIILLRQQLTSVLLRYAELACVLGKYYLVLPRLQALAAAEPLNESAHAHLMIALAGTGQQAAAIRVYEDLRSRLDLELGLYPGKELAEAHLRVLRQDIRAGGYGRVQSHHASSAAGAQVVPRQLPASPHYLGGRRDELDALSGLLERDSEETTGAVVAALTGPAGIGKTVLAIHWAHQVADRFPDGQLFVDLHGFGTPVAPTDTLYGFLTALGVPIGWIPEDVAGRKSLYRGLLADRHMLIVLDNVRNAAQVQALLPGSPGCLVLVTSRNQLTGLAAEEGARLLPMDVLKAREPSEPLTRSLGDGRASAEPAAVNELISLHARLPDPRSPVAVMVAETPEEREWLDAVETGESATSIRMAFSWSQARLSEVARWTFRLLGVHPGPDITVPAVASLGGLTRSQAYAALAELCAEHLVTEYAPGRYKCHEPLRAYAAEAAHIHYDDVERREAVHRVLDHYLRAANAASVMLYPYHVQFTREQLRPGVLPEEIDDPGQAAEWFRNERHVLLAAIGRAAGEAYAPHAWELPWAAGPFLSGKGCWRELTAAQESALVVACKLGDLAGQSLACHHLGLLLTGRVVRDLSLYPSMPHTEVDKGLQNMSDLRGGERRSPFKKQLYEFLTECGDSKDVA